MQIIKYSNTQINKPINKYSNNYLSIKLFRNLSIDLFICLFVYLFIAKQSFAQFSIGVYPPITQIEAIAPTTFETPINIQNSDLNEINLDIKFKFFKPSETNNGEITYLNNSDQITGNDPLILQKVSITDENGNKINNLGLAPLQEKKLMLHVDIPQDEPSGDYYFSIIFQSTSNQEDSVNASTINGSIATNVILSIGPTNNTTGFIKSFDYPFFIDHGPVSFNLLLANTSDHFIVPKGNLVISNMFNQVIGKINLLNVNVLSNSQRFIPGENNLQNNTSIIWNEKFLLGIYKAHLSILLSNKGPFFEQTVYFLALPWQLTTIFILLIIIAVSIYVTIKYRIKNYS